MWYIQIAETHLINLTFVDFNTRNSYPTTSEDKVLVYDAFSDGNLLLNHSGNSIPPPIISSSNRLLVTFDVGKRNIRAKGFKAIYTTVICIDFEIINSYIIILYIIHAIIVLS